VQVIILGVAMTCNGSDSSDRLRRVARILRPRDPIGGAKIASGSPWLVSGTGVPVKLLALARGAPVPYLPDGAGDPASLSRTSTRQTGRVTSTPSAAQFLARLLPSSAFENAVLFIIDYGVDRFENEIPDFIQATGMREENLRELVDEARLGSDPNAPKVKDQHLVSQVLLREWSTTTANGPRMGHYSTEFGVRPDISPESVAKLDSFVKIDSRRVEEVWGRVENTLHDAIAEAEACTLLSQPEYVATIKDAIALHYARSFDVKANSEAGVQSAVARKEVAMRADPELLDRLSRMKTGSKATPTPAEREEIVEDFTSGLTTLSDSGVLFRYRVVYLFKAARDLVANAGLELLRAPAAYEFVIGDVPVITTDRSGHLRGIEAGVPIGSAKMVAMPLSPRLYVSLAGSNSDQGFPERYVERFNTWQVEAAKRAVFTTVCSPLLGWMETIRPPSGPLSSHS
jgi:hypothetical protein